MMPLYVPCLLLLASLAWADFRVTNPNIHSAFGYIQNVGIPSAEAIRKAEELLIESRIVGGLPAVVGQYPFKAGLIGEVINTNARSVCGASLISSSRVLTAAHCWNDGSIQIWRFTVVLGSATLFYGGTRVQSSTVAMHPTWNPLLARNDIAVIYLPIPVRLSSIIAPVALPTGLQETEDYVGEPAIALGFGISADGDSISLNQSLNHVRLNVISNHVCSYAFPFVIQPSHICTSGLGGVSTCSGDSGGPLLATRNGQIIQIGIASFVSIFGCQSNLPAAFARITSYLDFIRAHV